MNETEQLTYEQDAWVALIEPFSSPHIIPARVGTEPTVPFNSVGKIMGIKLDVDGPTYTVAFHAGWTALDVPHKLLRSARMLEQLALCADGC